MNVLSDLQTTLGGLQIPIETGVFTDKDVYKRQRGRCRFLQRGGNQWTPDRL